MKNNAKNLEARLNDRVVIQQPVEAPDSAGGFTVAWQNVATIWAEVKHLGSLRSIAEKLQNDQINVQKKYLITIRYNKNLNEKMRVVFRDKNLNIRAIDDGDMHKQQTEILAEEGVAQ